MNHQKFDVTRYFEELRRQYAWAKEHGFEVFSEINTDAKGNKQTTLLLNGEYAKELGRFE